MRRKAAFLPRGVLLSGHQSALWRKLWFVALANFQGVNTPFTVDFKLPSSRSRWEPAPAPRPLTHVGGPRAVSWSLRFGAVVLKVWPLNQPQQHHLKPCEESKLSDPRPRPTDLTPGVRGGPALPARTALQGPIPARVGAPLEQWGHARFRTPSWSLSSS